MRLEEASILLVDDSPLLLDIMGELFRRRAGQVSCAADGLMALEILATHKIDLVITDIRMPQMDGITLLKKIKADGMLSPRLIFITGFSAVSAREAYDLGAEALLEKPIQFHYLIETVERSLLDPSERWRKQLDLSDSPVLNRSFTTLEKAFRENSIAFGRGGFCMETSKLLEHGSVNIELTFLEDGFVLFGQGVVRWLAHREGQIGIELTYVEEGSRARVVELAERSASFIPQTVGRPSLPLAA